MSAAKKPTPAELRERAAVVTDCKNSLVDGICRTALAFSKSFQIDDVMAVVTESSFLLQQAKKLSQNGSNWFPDTQSVLEHIRKRILEKMRNARRSGRSYESLALPSYYKTKRAA